MAARDGKADDEKLTAYALGELDEGGRAEVEARLEADPAARRFVEDVREVARMLGEHLAAEPAPRLTAAQRAAVEARAAAAGAARDRSARRSRIVLRAALHVAAVIVLAFGAAFVMHQAGVYRDDGEAAGPQPPARQGPRRGAPALLVAGPAHEGRAPIAPDQAGTVRLVPKDATAAGAVSNKTFTSLTGLWDMYSVTGEARRRGNGILPRDPALHNALVNDSTASYAFVNLHGGVTAVDGRLGAPGVLADTNGDGIANTGVAFGDTTVALAEGGGGTVIDSGAVVVNVAGSAEGINANGGTLTLDAGDTMVTGGYVLATTHGDKPDGQMGAAGGTVPVTIAAGEPTHFVLAYANAGDRPGHEGERAWGLARTADDPGGDKSGGDFRTADGKWNREAYDRIVENPFRKVADHPVSTFSIDVDTASYANVRRILNSGRLPPRGAVRIEEMVNYFPYDYAAPEAADERPFAAHAAVARCPWSAAHRLVRVALKGKELSDDSRPSSNFVFLLDVSGSMKPANKLPLVREAMKMLLDRLGENDRVAIAVYAGASGLVLDSTTCDRKERIHEALENLHAGGSTNGGAGITLAYRVALDNFTTGGVNRVILCTDGDFNVGTTSQAELVRLIEQKAKSGVFLSVLGFGMGNYQDSRLEKLADKGNGNYAYIDTPAEAKKVLVDQMTGTLVTIAKDVKIQVEFNPARVEAYRLIGYENRVLAREDFNDDTKDAGEIGAGHTVTALYEIVPAGQDAPVKKVDPLRYQTPAALTAAAWSNEILTLKLRYKKPDGKKSILMTRSVADGGAGFAAAPADFRFAASVAAFGMILRDSKYKGTYTLDAVIEQASSARGKDPFGYRAEFIELARTAKKLKER